MENMDAPNVEFVDPDDRDDCVFVYVDDVEYGAIVSGHANRWEANKDLAESLGYHRNQPDLFTWGELPYAEKAIAKRVEYLARGNMLTRGRDPLRLKEIAETYRDIAGQHRGSAMRLRTIGEVAAARRHDGYAAENDEIAASFEDRIGG